MVLDSQHLYLIFLVLNTYIFNPFPHFVVTIIHIYIYAADEPYSTQRGHRGRHIIYAIIFMEKGSLKIIKNFVQNMNYHLYEYHINGFIYRYIICHLLQ